MASYLNPQPSNAILDDIANIRELENYNAQSDPSLGSDFPVGAKRFINIGTTTAPKWQWQRYDGTSWQVMANTTTDKLMHNVDMLDGYHASTSAVANTIPVYNVNKLLVGGITGNAATATKLATARNLQVGGIASGDAKPFNGTAAVTLPINSINVNNAEDDAIVGVLTAKHGGTGRTDGAAQDVRVASLAGEVSAKAYGQLGRAREITASTHLDTLTVDGWYMSTDEITCTPAMGYPEQVDCLAYVRVSSFGSSLVQEFSVGGFRQYQRKSNNSGASWTGWMPIGGAVSGAKRLWVSKSGSDANSGLSESSPLLTINKALRIAAGISVGGTNSYVILCVGEGDWGDVVLHGLPFSLFIRPFDGSRPTEYSDALPRFGNLQVRGMTTVITGIVANSLTAFYGGTIFVDSGYKRIGAVRARQSSRIMFLSDSSASNVWEIHSQTVYTDALCSVYDDSSIDFAGFLHIRLAENLTASSAFLSVGRNARFGSFKSRTVFDATEYTFTGKKFTVANTAVLNSGESGGASRFFTEDLPGEGGDFVLGCIVNGYTMGQVANTDFNALDASVVKLTGDQTIAGAKTFTSALYQRTSAPFWYQQHVNVDKGTVPTSNYTVGSVFLDKNGVSAVNRIGALLSGAYTNGLYKTGLYAYAPVSGGTASAELSVAYPTSGAPYGLAPTTPVGSAGNQIVTADYLASANSGVVHTSDVGTENIYGLKRFMRSIITLDNVHTQWIGNAQRPYMYQNTSVTRGVTPDANVFCYTAWYSASGTSTSDRIAMNEMSYRADGSIQNVLAAFKPSATEVATARIGVVYPAEGTPFGVAPTPDENARGTHIATTEWVCQNSAQINWFSRSNRSQETWYTETSNGFLRVRISIGTNSQQSHFVFLQNGEEKSYVLQSSYNNSSNNSTVFIPIPKGLTYKLTCTQASSLAVQFMPFA